MANSISNKKINIDCHLCGSHGLWVFYEITNVPTNCNLLWTNKNEAVNCPKGNIKLTYCPSCSFVTNIALEPMKNQYGDRYDDSLFYSPRFQTFAVNLTKSLVQRYDLRNKYIVEIGGGKVDFISLLIGLGNNRGIRIDPQDSKHKESHSVENASGYCLESNYPEKIDFIFSYCELEHINYPKIFLNNIKEHFSFNSNAHLFFAVPNALKDFQEGNFTNIIYEHASYFTVPSLFYLFSVCGFDVLDVAESKNEVFDSIYVDAIPKSEKNSKFKPDFNHLKIESFITSFAEKSTNIIEKNTSKIKQLLDEKKRVFLWSAGSRGVTLLNILKDSRIEYAVDINPNKQGKFVPGTGQKIVPPKFLIDNRPDYIILSNPVYENEIKQILTELKIKAEFILM